MDELYMLGFEDDKKIRVTKTAIYEGFEAMLAC